MPIVPRDVKKALGLLQNDFKSERKLDELAAECGVAPRTLQKHFRRFVGLTPRQVRQSAQLEQVRRELLQARREDSVASIATRFGVRHLGRFASTYRERYGEPPSATLHRRISWLTRLALSPTILSPKLDRPVVAVHPFIVIGDNEQARASVIADEISIAVGRNRWLAVGTPPNARYHIYGRLHCDTFRRSRLLVTLSDAASGRIIWADRWSVETRDTLEFEERIANALASAINRSVYRAELDRAHRLEPSQSGAWELTMQALPRALTLNPAAQSNALELLERAMELAPHDALPVALAAWCRAQRGTHHFTRRSAVEKQVARDLVRKASALSSCDARSEALLATAETLGHDLQAAAQHCERALALDGGCTWAWMRNGFVHAYAGRSADAIESFQIARSLDPEDPLSFTCSVGMGIAYFEIGRFHEAAHWWTRLIEEHPSAVWANRFRAPALLFAGRKEEAEIGFSQLRKVYPELTISEVRGALPHTEGYLDRACEGLEHLGMQS